MNPTNGCSLHIADLSDYLDTGTSPDAAHIENCPQCHARLAGLRSLSAAAHELMDDDVASATSDASWLDGILASLRLETRAGRPIPLQGGPDDELTETEGAVIALVRSVGDSLGGVLIGRCRLEGEVSVPGAPVEVRIHVSARYGYPLPTLAQQLREAVWAQLLVHTELNVVAVHVAFTDLRPPLDEAFAQESEDFGESERSGGPAGLGEDSE
ncbi:Asp23/Gls24 family envelope stress response protein [Arthrobacter psychrochitiniphilus]|uniref:Asp23/Gls24 family envelope stress response protein n=1 Tax=Arthrobacter psychrochitiniphilus TaxID=291045 RepID=UPI003F7B95B3